MSAATGEGFDALLDGIIELLSKLPPVLVYEEEELELSQTYAPGFTLRRDDDGAYVLEGGQVQKLLDTTDPNSQESMRRFQQILIKSGMISALREAGAKEGDTIRLGGWDFDFVE